MAWDDLGRLAEEEGKHEREKWIGVYIGVLAVMLAICSMGGGNAAKEMTLKHVEAATAAIAAVLARVVKVVELIGRTAVLLS